MRQVKTAAALRAFVSVAPRPIGLVPTMGALHDGHLALVRRASAECATVVASIFVNPKQFGPGEDLTRYPRPLARDLDLLREAGVDAAFTPAVEEMDPDGSATTIEVRGPALPLEGALRPGHFAGVATVVSKLLMMTLPDRAYFGQKDGQQLAVVRRLVADLDIPVQVVAVPTVREPDGLAMSSRNAYLTPAQRAAAPVVRRALAAAEARHAGGEHGRDALEAACRQVLEREPEVTRVEYVALIDADTMEPWDGARPAMLAVAVRLGATRLIDNVLLGAPDTS